MKFQILKPNILQKRVQKELLNQIKRRKNKKNLKKNFQLRLNDLADTSRRLLDTRDAVDDVREKEFCLDKRDVLVEAQEKLKIFRMFHLF